MATPARDGVGLTGDSRIDGIVEGGASSFGGQRVETYSSAYTGFQAGAWMQTWIDALDQAFRAHTKAVTVTGQM